MTHIGQEGVAEHQKMIALTERVLEELARLQEDLVIGCQTIGAAMRRGSLSGLGLVPD